MLRIIGIAIALAFSSIFSSFAQTGKEWDDPKTTSVNREKAHTVGIPWASEKDVTNPISESPYFLSLDGKWKFYWVKSPSSVSEANCAKDYNDAA